MYEKNKILYTQDEIGRFKPATLEEIMHCQVHAREIIEHEVLAKYHSELAGSYERAFEEGGKSNDYEAASWHFTEHRKHAALAQNLKQGRNPTPKT